MFALLSCFYWLFCILDYFVNTEYVNSHYPVDIPCNLFTKCLFQNCPVCVDCIALSGCSVLSIILSTQTSCNSYYPVDIPSYLFTECLFQRLTCLHYYLALICCSVLSTILSSIGCSVNLLSCLHWLRVTLTIQLTFPVICLLNAYFKDWHVCITILFLLVVLYSRLSCLHRLLVTLQSSWHSL